MACHVTLMLPATLLHCLPLLGSSWLFLASQLHAWAKPLPCAQPTAAAGPFADALSGAPAQRRGRPAGAAPLSYGRTGRLAEP